MVKKNAWRYSLIILVVAICAVAIGIAMLFGIFNHGTAMTPIKSDAVLASDPNQPDMPTAQLVEAYEGMSTTVADRFSLRVPSGWRASISENSSFLAIMFARPNQLESLVYTTNGAPAVDRDGIPAWSGLTEHFFVIEPTASQAFKPGDHQEVSSQTFAFDDGTVGTQYLVVKRADEAQRWGGLQKDAEWQGRTYIYEKDERRVEAHIALYPSTKIPLPLYEDVVRSLQF